MAMLQIMSYLFVQQHPHIRGPTLKWIQAFFYDWTQTVVLENEKSDIEPVTSGLQALQPAFDPRERS